MSHIHNIITVSSVNTVLHLKYHITSFYRVCAPMNGCVPVFKYRHIHGKLYIWDHIGTCSGQTFSQ